MIEPIRLIDNISDYHFCVGRVMYFCQCIEHDIKLIYKGMRRSISNKELIAIEKWTFGKTLIELRNLDNSDRKPYFSNADYELLNKIKDIRNHYAHECYTEFTYEQDDDWDVAFSKSSKRLVNDHNRLLKLYHIVENVRLKFFGYE